MIRICQHIEYLLARHDCVVVPHFGAFLSQYVPAQFNADTHTIIPPSRSVGFNPEVNVNDGLLADSVMRRHRLTRQAAMDAIAVEVESLRHQLCEEGNVAIGRIGILHAGSESGSPVFEPLASAAVLTRYTGLPEIGMPEITVPEKAGEPKVAVREKGGNLPRFFKVAAAAIAAVCVGIVLSTTTLHRNSQVSHASLDSGLSSRAEEVIKQQNPTAASPLRVLSIAIPADSDAIALVDTAKPRVAPTVAPSVPVKPKKTVNLRHNDGDPYLIVVASLSTPQQAQKFIAEKNDSSLRFVAMDGYYRVYAATATTSRGGRAAIASLSGRYPSAWLCMK